MNSVFLLLLGMAAALGVVWFRSRFGGFLSQTPEHYSQASAGQFDLRRHLNGPVDCEGVIYGPLGRVTSRFVARFDVSWDGNTGTMVERFVYDDGSEQERAWRLCLGNDGRIRATASDVEGEGQGVQSGDSVRLTYRLRLPEASGGHVLDVVDWMYLTPNGNIINRSQFRKFGIKVAELVATMRPNQTEERRAA